MYKKIIGLILTLTLFTGNAFAGALQGADFATPASITGAGGSLTQLLNANYIYDEVNSQQLSVTLADLIYANGSVAFTGNQSLGGFAISTQIANASSVGTTVNKLAKLTGAPSTAVIAATTDTKGVIGIVISGAGTTGSAQIAQSGIASCVFDAGGTVAGDYVTISALTAGDCADAGASYPSSGQVLGRVLSTHAGTGTYAMTVDSPDIVATTMGTGTVTSVALADGSTTPIYTISGSPVTTSGTLTETLMSQSANTVFAAPDGSSGQPGFRALVAADIPALPYQASFTWQQEVPSGTVNNSNVTFTLAHTPKSNGSALVYLDGLVLNQGVDYTLSSATITMAVAPNYNQKIYASYAY